MSFPETARKMLSLKSEPAQDFRTCSQRPASTARAMTDACCGACVGHPATAKRDEPHQAVLPPPGLGNSNIHSGQSHRIQDPWPLGLGSAKTHRRRLHRQRQHQWMQAELAQKPPLGEAEPESKFAAEDEVTMASESTCFATGRG